MSRPRTKAVRYFRAREAAEVMGMALSTWRRYWRAQPDLVAGAVELPGLRAGPKGDPVRAWPEPVLARHQQVIELRSEQ